MLHIFCNTWFIPCRSDAYITTIRPYSYLHHHCHNTVCIIHIQSGQITVRVSVLVWFNVLLTHLLSRSCDLDLDSMTLILDLDTNIFGRTCTSKTNFLGQGFAKLEPEQDRPTHRQTDATVNITTPHSLVVQITELWIIFSKTVYWCVWSSLADTGHIWVLWKWRSL